MNKAELTKKMANLVDTMMEVSFDMSKYAGQLKASPASLSQMEDKMAIYQHINDLRGAADIMRSWVEGINNIQEG